nr:cysteine-rich CWC family protein [Vibrio mediterranei]
MTKTIAIATPCKAACKNEGGICSGCFRTMDELSAWRLMEEEERDDKMEQLAGSTTTHVCPKCGEAAYCDISAGHDTCWCFELDKRDTSSIEKSDLCLCRKCLSTLPIE